METVRGRMQWWHCGPVVLAVIMFLLVGTIMERYLEAALIRFLDRYLQPLPQSAEAEASTEETCPAPEQPAAVASHRSMIVTRQSLPKLTSRSVDRLAIDLVMHRAPEIDDI